MDTAMHERTRAPHHGLVTALLAVRAGALLALVAGVAGGLLRATPVSLPTGLPDWLLAGAAWHAALMTSGFLGSVIALERAVAARHRAGLLAPLASTAGAALLVAGRQPAGAALLVAASAIGLVTNLVIVRRQVAAPTVLLAMATGAWLVGNGLFLAGRAGAQAWWLAFLVVTVAAERLEMTRLVRRARTTTLELVAIALLMFAGATALSCDAAPPAVGLATFGASLALLSAWLFARDIATRTIRADGLARYMAVCLLAGNTWLALSAAGWMALARGLPGRDLALHGVGLGFLVSMMMAHAPVILPALTRVRVRFGLALYAPVALLHASLVLRLLFGAGDAWLRGLGALLNAVALITFAATLAWHAKARHPD